MEATKKYENEIAEPVLAADASRARIWSDDVGVLHVQVDDREFRDVRPIRVFPLSKKADYVSFLSQKGGEVALIRNVAHLDAASRDALDHALERMYYTARITEVLAISETMGISHWRVMTDRGYARFDIVARDHIREMPGGKYVIIDADGSRFEIPCLANLDPRSQALVFSET